MMEITDYKLNALCSPIDERDISYSDVACVSNSEVVIPKSFHLNYQFEPKNQGQVGSCFFHAYSELEEIVYAMNEQFSVGFLYGTRDDTDSQNSGIIPRQGLKHGVNDGNVLYRDFPINEEYPSIKNTIDKYGKEQLLAKAQDHRAKGYISLTVEDIKRYLVTEQKPIIIITKVYRNFYEMQYNGGIIPSTPEKDYMGNHAQLILGFDDDILDNLNSWGNIGDNGHTHLDLNSSIIKELWAITDEKVVIPTKKTYWRVQVSANKLKESAEDDCKKLAIYGIDTCPVLVNGWWKVQCGCFCNITFRDIMIKKLEDLGYKVYVEKFEK